MVQSANMSFRISGVWRFSYGGGAADAVRSGPSIRLHLVKQCLDLALAHFPDRRDDSELLGP